MYKCPIEISKAQEALHLLYCIRFEPTSDGLYFGLLYLYPFGADNISQKPHRGDMKLSLLPFYVKLIDPKLA